MNNTPYHENSPRGTIVFPLDYHYINEDHARYEMPFHWHIENEFILIKEGTLDISIDGRRITLSAGEGAFLIGGAVHGAIPKDCIYECLVLDLHRFLDAAPFGSSDTIFEGALGASISYAAESTEAKILSRVFSEMKNADVGYEWRVTGLLYELVGASVLNAPLNPYKEDKRSQGVRRVKQVLRKIRREYMTPLTLGDLAEVAGVSEKYLCRLFSDITGRTPIDYLNYYRIERACEELLSSYKSITEIAIGCGYNDPSYFVKQFRRYKIDPPGIWRAKHK